MPAFTPWFEDKGEKSGAWTNSDVDAWEIFLGS
jgi:hypothetical protein